MASKPQINYVKRLLTQNDRSLKDYPIDDDTPGKAASWLIDHLKDGIDFSATEYEEKIKEFSNSYQEQSQPVVKSKGGGYDRSIFNPTLMKIKSTTIKTFLSAMLDEVPSYFYVVPASSTGKYHPSFALGDGGLVRHTLAALQVAEDIIDNNSFMVQLPRGGEDMLRAALTIHDGWKQGLIQGQHTTFIHPLLPGEVYKSLVKKKLNFNEDQEAVIEQIISAIDCHMGPWNSNRNEATVLPVPETPLQLAVHLCDYIASRTYLTLKA